jgi:tripartite-type tricarboxylate transporter receptor subunit TctC
MVETRRRVIALGAATALASGLRGIAFAAGYPDRPVHVFLPVAAGTGLDVDARVTMEKFAELLGQSVVIENRPQAGGNVAMSEVSKAVPDGYTLIAAGIGPAVANAYLYKNPGYDTQRDFVPISLMQILPSVLVVHPSLGVNSVQELITLAKEKPGDITYGSQGVGTFVHLAVEQFMATTGTKLTHVPYGRQNPFSDLAGGHVKLMISGVAPVMGFIKSGMVKALVVSAKERISVLPDVPTAAEAGIPEFQAYTWNGLFAPRGTPEPILARLNADIGKAVLSPSVKERMARFGGYPAPGTPAEFVSFLDAERAKWSKVIMQAKVQLD